MSALEVLRELRLPLWKVPAVLSDFRKIMRERIDEIRPFPDIVDVLHTMMRERISVAVATSNSIDNVRVVLGEDLLERFVAVECGSSLFGKSHRLRRILKQGLADGGQAIYIGDEILDAEAARRVGLSFGAVAWGYTDLDALARTRPDRVFRQPADLRYLGQFGADRCNTGMPLAF